MLNDFVNSSSQGTLITIQDNSAAKGWNLFKAVLKSDIQDININKIHLVCFENSSTYYADEDTKIMKYDFFKNPYSLTENNSQFFSLFNKILGARDVTSTVFIDSINVLMYMENTNGVYSILKTLKDGFKNLKCILHTDIVEDCEIIDKINFFSNMVLKLHAVLPGMSGFGKYIGVDGVYQKSSGKIKKLKEIFHVDLNYNVHSKVCDKEDKNKCYRSVNQNLKSLTTFRLGLDMNESERIARDNLVLPYIRSRNKKSKDEKEGKILYYAEVGDDEEEDPDDDLDI